MVLKAFSYLLIALYLVSCTSGPVPVRDTVTVPDSSDPSLRETPGKTAPVPLSSELKQRAEQNLQHRRWEQAILLAERGLRIDRKEPFFYWVLSTAYQQLSKIQQSIDFARQGLRYVSGDSGLKNQLLFLSTQ